MRHAMDQYLASALTSQHVLQVVTDPKRAEVVFTDRIGEPLEEQLKTWFPPPPPPSKEKAPEAAKDKQKEDAKPAAKSTSAGDIPVHVDPVGNMSSFSRGKGTFFLVDVKTRQVLWSTYQRPGDSTSGSLARTAERVVAELKKNLEKQ